MSATAAPPTFDLDDRIDHICRRQTELRIIDAGQRELSNAPTAAGARWLVPIIVANAVLLACLGGGFIALDEAHVSPRQRCGRPAGLTLDGAFASQVARGGLPCSTIPRAPQ